MYKIMLAEDEPEVLDAIMEIIDWSRFSFEKPVGCRDGREAIGILESGFRPDALITDISMPFVDGLKLTEYVMEHNPKTVVVVLSGYDEFAYAQKALRMQVYDYVLKPVTPNRIRELLGRVSEELDTRRIYDIEDSMQVLRHFFLHRLLERSLDDTAIAEGCVRHQLSFDNGSCLVAVIDADNTAASDDGPDNEYSLEMLRYALSNIAEELAGNSGAIAYQAQDGATRLIVCGWDDQECRANAEALAKSISQAVRQNLPGTVSAGIGDPVPSPGKLHISRAQAEEALSYRFFHGECSVLSYRDICGHPDGHSGEGEADISPLYARVEEAVMGGDRETALASISEIFARLADNRCSLERCIICCQRLTMILYRVADRLGGDQPRHTLEQLWERANLSKSSTIGRIERGMRQLCDEALDLFQPEQMHTATAHIAKAESYIREHFSDPELSLQTITRHLAVSVSYFSPMFKSRTGCTFVEYLTKMRMDKARQLLALSDCRSYEIAADVGFSDPHYFSIAFKRFTGMSPREFREYSRQNDDLQR